MSWVLWMAVIVLVSQLVVLAATIALMRGSD